MPKTPMPSPAQAKFIAWTWSGFMNAEVNVGDFRDATTAACIKNGWLTDTGRTGLFPNRSEYKIYVLSDTAMDALAGYLLDQRYKHIAAKAG
jgi:hypothetical protein